MEEINSSKLEPMYKNYCSLKIFLRFWLAKIPRIIHYNQLLLTKSSSPKLANKQADELNIDGGKHVYSLFLN